MLWLFGDVFSDAFAAVTRHVIFSCCVNVRWRKVSTLLEVFEVVVGFFCSSIFMYFPSSLYHARCMFCFIFLQMLFSCFSICRSLYVAYFFAAVVPLPNDPRFGVLPRTGRHAPVSYERIELDYCRNEGEQVVGLLSCLTTCHRRSFALGDALVGQFFRMKLCEIAHFFGGGRQICVG